MTLHNSDALILETVGDPTPSLPDPTTVGGRTHELVNAGVSAAVWGSTGAAPFQVDGAAVATLTVARGASARVQSDGVRWVLIRASGTRRLFAGKATSDGSGNVTFTFTPPFPTVPVVSPAIETTNTNVTEARITALTASSCTVNVRQSPGVVVLGISVLQVPQPLSGATVHLTATEAGQG
jgi:hypothetical protein